MDTGGDGIPQIQRGGLQQEQLFTRTYCIRCRGRLFLAESGYVHCSKGIQRVAVEDFLVPEDEHSSG